MNVLLFKPGAIGDVIMTTPLIRQLRKGLGDNSKIGYMIGGRSVEILEGNPYLDEVITFDEGIFPNRDIIAYSKLLLQMRKLSKTYDAVILLEKHMVFYFTGLLGGFKKRYGFNRVGKEGKFLTDKVYWDATKREVEYYLDFLEFFGIKPDYDDQRYDVFNQIFYKDLNKLDSSDIALLSRKVKSLSQIDELVNTLKKTGKKIIGISTGGGNKFSPKGDCRWWHMDNWNALAKKLIEQGNIVILLGKGDRELDFTDPNFYNLLGKYSFHETLYFISKLDFVICQESGFIHFVGCTNTPMLALAGPTNPYRFYPHFTATKPHPIGWIWKMEKECYDVYGGYGNCQGDEIDTISVDEVLAKLSNLI